MAKSKAIKSPTVRKVRNRGFEPVIYHTYDGIYSCWIEKVGTKKLWVRFTNGKLKKVPLDERKYMRTIPPKNSPTPATVAA